MTPLAGFWIGCGIALGGACLGLGIEVGLKEGLGRLASVIGRHLSATSAERDRWPKP